ncbi:glycoside hydrolase family 99-like domain-containing protein [Pseudomonas sp. PS02303]|uniref:glycoside hydrolase family 99-like domain-containing protein n=1 Tax=Pseudomonas sp. PS02303 TaxID=2991429 RepID=UPI00249BA73E|nr:glycoside hydrolase family 99-like domain-containing protein [Pseudomonas sp. PS02303]
MDKEKLLQYLRGSSYRSERYRILYVATPKVACTSLKWWFAALEGKALALREVTDSSESDPDLTIHDNFHKLAPEVLGLPPETIEDMLRSDSYFRFAVVRNPYKRIFSAWQSKLLLQEPLQVGPYTKFEFFHHPLTSSADIAAAFEGFLEHLASNEAPTYWNLHWTPQAQLLRPDLINYSSVFKIENRNELGVALTEWAGEYIPSPFAGRRTNESLIPYLTEFMTARSAELIRTLYAEDFDVFGYDREPPATKEVFSEGQFDLAFKAIKFIRGRHQRLGARNVQCTDLSQAIVARDGHISSLNQAVDQRDGQISTISKVVVEQQGQIAGLNQLVIERSDSIDGYEQKCAEYERGIANLDQLIVQYKAHIGQLDQIVAERDGLIAHLAQSIQERDFSLAQRDVELATLTGHITRLELDMKQQVDTIQYELSRMLRSRSWRVTGPLRKIANYFRPKGLQSDASFVGKVANLLMVHRRLALRSSIRRIRASSLFDIDYYSANYPDVQAAGMAPEAHYFLYGWKEHRNPSVEFNTAQYLIDNPDVQRVGVNPLYHYLKWGKKEGRQVPALPDFEANVIDSESECSLSNECLLESSACVGASDSVVLLEGISIESDNAVVVVESVDIMEFATSSYEANVGDSCVEINSYSTDIEELPVEFAVPVVEVDTTERDAAAKAVIDAEVEAISKSGRFDESFYLSMYAELDIEHSEAIRHYCERGWKEGLNPSDDFDTKSYLSTYSDIRNANLNPFWHYVVAGASELRHAVPDSAIRYENPIRFGGTGADLKLLAFFSSPDWVSLRNGRPAFKGNSQPLLPHEELGFYDGLDGKVLDQQATLARQHGLYGFCFELSGAHNDASLPVDLFLKCPEIGFNFCVQFELKSTDIAKTILVSLRRALLDERYIKVDDRPVIITTLSCEKQYAGRILRKLRSELSAQGFSNIFLIVRGTLVGRDTSMASLADLCDAILDLPVNPVPEETGSFVPLKKNGVEVVPYAVIASQGVARCQRKSSVSCPLYQAVTLGRDNTAQETDRPLMYSRFHIRDYRRWLDAAISSAKRILPEDRRFVFVNAWNDWNAGLFLEPDRQGGFGRLNETTRALLGVVSGATMPKVSVIVPNYNHERFLNQRLDSIYGQTYQNIEVILLDDCSTDQSRKLLNKYASANPETTRTLFNEVNSGGPFRQWAKGIKAATGDLVWIAESDDYCDERFLEELVSTFEDEAVLLAYAKSVFVNADGVPMQDEHKMYVSDLECAEKWNESYVETAHNEVRVALGVKNTIPNASGVVFKRPVDMALLDNEAWLSMSAAGDWVFYLHQIRGGKIAYSCEATNFFRRYEGSAAESTYKKEAFYRELGMSGRTVQELYNVPLALLEQSKSSCKAMYDYHAVGSDEQFLEWYGVDSILQARANRKPNILISTMGFYPGGAEILPIRMANEFKRQGLSVLLLSAGLNPREDGVRRMLRNDVPLIETSDVEATKNIIREFGVDALNTHQWHIQKYPLYIPDVFDQLGSHVASLHGMIEHGNAFGVTEDQLRTADKGVTTWVYTAQKNLGPFSNFSLYDESSPRFVKLPNGMMPSVIVPIPRPHMGIPESAFVLCCVSRAILDKGWAEAILAVEHARKLSGCDIRLVLVGNGPVYDEYCREGTPDFVYLAGFSENSVGHYASADMGIMLTTFKSESFPLTIVDCLFAGKPYIASDVGDIKNMLSTQDDMAGEVVRLDDWEVPIEKAGEVIASFATDKARYAKVLELVPDVASRYKIDVVAKQYVDLFQRDMALSVAEASSDS